MKDLMYLVVNQNVFGAVFAHAQVIELQKRGILHAYVVFLLDEVSENDLRRPENVDRIITAETPFAQDPENQEALLKHMVYNPCRKHIPKAVCMGEYYWRKGSLQSFKQEKGQSESEYYITCRRSA